MSFDPLSVSFRVDDELDNYETILDWLYYLHDPETGNKKEKNIATTLQMYSPKGRLIREFQFRGLFPIGMSGINFKTNTDDTEYLEATVRFSYDYFFLKKKN